MKKIKKGRTLQMDKATSRALTNTVRADNSINYRQTERDETVSHTYYKMQPHWHDVSQKMASVYETSEMRLANNAQKTTRKLSEQWILRGEKKA